MSEEQTVEKVTYEQKVEKAKGLLNELSNPELTLSNSVKIYKDGLKEIEDAQKMLDEAKLNFETLNKE